MFKYFVFILLFCLVFSETVSAQKGEQYELKSITFEGNNGIASGTLKGIINSQETPWWFWKFLNSFTSFGNPPSYFDSSTVPIDIEAIREFYEANGYFKIKITHNIDADTSAKKIILKYVINEGPISKYGVLNVRGLRRVPEPLRTEVLKLIKVDSSSRFSQQKILSDATSLTADLTNNGYMEARYDSTLILKDTLHDRADLDVFFTSGRRYIIDSVLVNKTGEGAVLVDDDLIKKLSGFVPGEYYSSDKIKRKQATLFRTSIFTSLALSASVRDTVGDKVPLRIIGTIGPLNELSPEIILNNQQNAFNVGLGATYVKKNFLGEARKLTLNSSFGVSDIFRFNLSHLTRRYSFRDTTLLGYIDARAVIEQPNLFGKDIYGTLENYLTIQKLHTLNTTIYGSKLTFEFQLPSYTFVNFLNMYYNIEQVNEFYITKRDSLYRSLLSIIGMNIGRNTTDDNLFPTSGYNISMLLEEANILPYLVGKLIKNEFTGTLFYKITWVNTYYTLVGSNKNIVFATKLKLGHLQPWLNSFSGIPNIRTFYAGGSNSLRGWRSNQLPGLDIKGGGFLVDGSFELRFRFLKDFGTSLFLDYGNEWLNYTYFRYKDIATDVGFGLKYYTSVAPFRLDFGIKLYNPEDRRYIFGKNIWQNIVVNFGIGEAF
jgi:outer membrane protein assembly factor BamA